MSVYYDKNKGRWRFSFNRIVKGQRVRSTKLLPKGWSRAQAEKHDRQETASLYAVATGVERPEPAIGAAVALYLEHRVPKLRNGPKVVKDLAFLYEYIDGKPMSALADVARDYIKEHQELADGTIHNRLAYLKAACRYAWKKHKLTQFDPTGHMEIPKPKNERLVDLSVDRLERFLRGIEDEETRAIFTLAFYTGSRWISEILPRKPEDVRRHGKDVELKVGLTKNGTPRLVPVPPAARWALTYLPFQWGEAYYRDRFNTARSEAGLGGFWRHDMRHVLGAAVVRRSGSQRDAMEALHHQSIQSSLRYTKFATSRLKEVLYGVGQARKVHTAGRRRKLKKAA